MRKFSPPHFLYGLIIGFFVLAGAAALNPLLPNVLHAFNAVHSDMETSVAAVQPHISKAPEPVLQVHAPNCTLLLTVELSATAIPTGGSIVYSVIVQNDGLLACKNSSITAFYSDKETFDSASLTPSTSNYYWNAKILAPGSTIAARIITKHNIQTGSGTILNKICATADNAKETCINSAITVAGGISLTAKELPTHNRPDHAVASTSARSMWFITPQQIP